MWGTVIERPGKKRGPESQISVTETRSTVLSMPRACSGGRRPRDRKAGLLLLDGEQPAPERRVPARLPCGGCAGLRRHPGHGTSPTLTAVSAPRRTTPGPKSWWPAGRAGRNRVGGGCGGGGGDSPSYCWGACALNAIW